jgi:hypothetical protein
MIGSMLEIDKSARAVLKCVRCSFDTCDFEDEVFRKKIFRGVAVPLRVDYEYATCRTFF